jgi:hypothetical protein
MNKIAPEIQKRNKLMYQRTLQLTRDSITKLESEGKRVTLNAIIETSRGLETSGKGISCAKTILHNAEAVDLFHEHSPAYHKRQQFVKKVKRKRAPIKKDIRTAYKGLISSDWITLAEDMKHQIKELKTQLVKYQEERDEAYKVRNEALQINTRLVVQLKNVLVLKKK